MPDIDIDFCMNRRGEVIEYVTAQVWPRAGGADHHLQHHGGEGGDQGRGAARRWICRTAMWDRIAKLVPATDRHHHRAGAERLPPATSCVRSGHAGARKLVDTARKLEGLVRGAGCACLRGVVIAPKPLTELVAGEPVEETTKSSNRV